MQKEVFMTEPEISRGDIFLEISQKKLTQRKAAELLGLSDRHINRLYTKFLEFGIIFASIKAARTVEQ